MNYPNTHPFSLEYLSQLREEKRKLKPKPPEEPPGMVIPPNELRIMTGKKRSDAQQRVLDGLGIRYTVRPNKSLVVLRAHAEAALGAEPTTLEPKLHL